MAAFLPQNDDTKLKTVWRGEDVRGEALVLGYILLKLVSHRDYPLGSRYSINLTQTTSTLKQLAE